MRVDLFDFELPRDRIAARPASPRDSSRLLEIGTDGLTDRRFCDLAELLTPGDMLVFNDSRVIPARLSGRRGDVAVEATLHKKVHEDCWDVFARPARRLRVSDRIDFAEGFAAEVVAKGEGGEFRLRFTLAGADMTAALRRHGVMPLPPYIPRDGGPDTGDEGDYQTVYARHDGAVAAPTAGLHFTDALLRALGDHGVLLEYVTLHVGAGTFIPVKTADTDDHPMHGEIGLLDDAAAARINQARDRGGRIIAVGTTSLRLLESAADPKGRMAAFAGETRLFITPGYEFKAVDGLITNFHTPRSTLYMLVCALAGMDRMAAAYDHAKGCGYRFYSYGDSCFIPRARS